MASFMKEYEYLKIQLKEIRSATNNFDENKVIGKGGFGKVYEGELCHFNSEKKTLVALKRLDRKYGQGDPQFWKEIMMLSRYRHENLISLLGYCIEEGEMILIYEHASRGSLERYLKDASRLTWTKRIKICLVFRRSLREERPSMSFIVEELKDAFEVQERHVIFSKFSLPKEYEEIVQSATSCLMYTEELKGLLSKGVLVNKGKTWLSINEKGEHIERIYIQACINPAEIEAVNLKHPPSDIVNSRFPGGRCYEYDWQEFKARVRDGEAQVSIIYPTNMREDGWFTVPLYHFTSHHTTADLQFEFEARATDLLVAGIEFQPSEDKVELQVFEEYQHIIEAASQSLACRSFQELKQILSVGIHLNGYKTWFSINEKGEHCHMISMEDCLIPNEDFPSLYKYHYQSRFSAGLYQPSKGFKTHIKTQLLSPSITYSVNLVFGIYSIYANAKQRYIDFEYRLKGMTTTSTVYLANPREYDHLCYMAELYQFTSDGNIVDLEIDFENFGINIERVEGILFQPLEKVSLQIPVYSSLSIFNDGFSISNILTK
ncbi:kinase-like domain, phloem protein 2-like protein [Tanacetum coccineum]